MARRRYRLLERPNHLPAVTELSFMSPVVSSTISLVGLPKASAQSGIPCELNLPDFVESSFCWFDPVGRSSEGPSPRILDRVSEKRRREYQAGRLCAFRALELADCAQPGLLESGPDRLPLWPKGWRGSISHSAGLAVAAVARSVSCAALGVDVEMIVSDVVAAEIRHEIMSAEEHALLGAMDECTTTTIVFSAKESLFKALYPHAKMLFDFKAARLVELDARSMRLELTQNWSRYLRKGMVLEASYSSFESYVFTAVCIPVPTESSRFSSEN